MKIKLEDGFSDIEINGQLEVSPFVPGDEIDLISITQHCEDLGCCEVCYTFTTDEWNDGLLINGYKYLRKSEIPNFASWVKEWDRETLRMMYYPERKGAK